MRHNSFRRGYGEPPRCEPISCETHRRKYLNACRVERSWSGWQKRLNAHRFPINGDRVDPWRYQKYRAVSSSDEARGNLVMGPQFHRRPFRSIRSIQCSFIADASYWLCLLNIFSFQPLDRLSVISAISDWLAETNLFFDSILRFDSHELFPARISSFHYSCLRRNHFRLFSTYQSPVIIYRSTKGTCTLDLVWTRRRSITFRFVRLRYSRISPFINHWCR